MIVLPPLGHLGDELWTALLDIADHGPPGWTLVGGQMVLLHGLEQGVAPPRVSTDLDLVVDARVRPPAIPAMAAVLGAHGFLLDAIAPDGVGHRFTRGRVSVDVLAPEGTGERAALGVGAGAVTVPIGGGTFALGRTEWVPVRVADREGSVPRPDLAGAVLLKAHAALADRRRGPERHLSDLAFLLGLARDPYALREALGPRNRARIRRVTALADGADPAWAGTSSDAKAAYTIVTGRDVS
ncbi:MAG: nucleotidyl transferase AbiEii/AbiGii toxin family protein [Thermoleophilia bacterium]